MRGVFNEETPRLDWKWSVFDLSSGERVSQLVGGEDCGVKRWSGFPVMQESDFWDEGQLDSGLDSMSTSPHAQVGLLLLTEAVSGEQ